MKYEEFLDYIEENIINYLPFAYQDAKVKYISYLKDGRQSESMIITRSTANGIGISPAIPLAPIYMILREGTSIDCYEDTGRGLSVWGRAPEHIC